MIKKIISTVICLIVFMPTISLGFDKWTKEDSFYQSTYTALRIIDWGQTRNTANNPDKFRELNPILGEHPSIQEVNAYFAITLVGHTAIAYILPSKYRRIWQVMWIGQSAGTVIRNIHIGTKVEF